MFSKRTDGRAIKTLDPIFKLIPHIMRERSDSQNFYKQEFTSDILDTYIREKRTQGYDFDYMTILMASTVRLFALRPALNRFIMNGRIFARNEIVISFVIKKALRDDADETIIKLKFTGKETIYEVSEKIKEAVKFNKAAENDNSTDVFAEKFLKLPNSIVKFLIGLIMWLDKINAMPNSIIELSPFHTGAFITNIKSIKLNYMYHHLYNFGTTSLFVSLGKNNKRPVSIDEEVEVKNVFALGFVMDERICDGLYLSNSLRTFERYFNDPHLLEEPLDAKIEDID